ncbi:MAG: helix-turn-helix transcriptional regulator [Usitatibacteraceae bacterium]
MTAIQMVSELPLASQAALLQSFVQSKGGTLLPHSAMAICQGLNLHVAADKKTLARALQQALADHQIRLAYSAGLEVIAHLCGFPSYMRFRQQILSLVVPSDATQYALQILKTGTDESSIEMFDSLPALATRVIALIGSAMPNVRTPSLCTLGRAPQAITLDLETESSWLTLHAFPLIPRESEYQLGDFSPDAIIEFGRRIERLEHLHDGLMFTGTVFCPTLPHWYHLSLVATVGEGETKTALQNEIAWYVAFESAGLTELTQVDADAYTVCGTQDTVSFAVTWTSGVNGETANDSWSPAAFLAIAQRFLRLKRVTGMPLQQFISRLAIGRDRTEHACRLDADLIEGTLKSRGLTLVDLARDTGLDLPVLLRMVKYESTPPENVPKIARVLGFADANALLPGETGKSYGFRIQEGTTLLKSTLDTHWWSITLSDNIPSEHHDDVRALAEEIRDCVELAQMSSGDSANFFAKLDEPIDEAAMAPFLQQFLDQLHEMGTTVLVTKSTRFMPPNDRTPGLADMPMQITELYFEIVEKLEPGPFAVRPGRQDSAGASAH